MQRGMAQALGALAQCFLLGFGRSDMPHLSFVFAAGWRLADRGGLLP